MGLLNSLVTKPGQKVFVTESARSLHGDDKNGEKIVKNNYNLPASLGVELQSMLRARLNVSDRGSE